jgi:two-component system, chemotaxis family, chemotaxis protein CheY
MKAAIIDDSRAMRMIIGRTLKELGFEVTEAANGREGLDCLENNPQMDLVLVDWNMPEMNGLEFVQALRGNQSLSHLPVMVVTSETEASQAERALLAGANEYVTKPFSKEELVERLSRLGFPPQ